MVKAKSKTKRTLKPSAKSGAKARAAATTARARTASSRSAAPTLLVELLTEELPPKSLARLSEAFAREVAQALADAGFCANPPVFSAFATPRRLAVTVAEVRTKQPEQTLERRGPAVKGALDANGAPTPALLGFAKSCGVEWSALQRQEGDKGAYFVFQARQPGVALSARLADIVGAAAKKLPVQKTMRWGSGDAEFVRPLHGVVMLHGERVLAGTVLGVASGRHTRGHRFLRPGVVTLARADGYATALKKAFVMADFGARRDAIARALDAAAKRLRANWQLTRTHDLLNEVTSLVEWPAVYTGKFSEAFLQVPKECLINSMQQHQKYFPLEDASGALLPAFLFVSNIETTTPKFIVNGNQRVLKARLADAKFFFDQDRKTPLTARTPKLAQVVYHNKLGTQLQRVERIARLAGDIGRKLKLPAADEQAVTRAAQLCKSDLLTDMVGEFPELQGIMGRYYALNDGESAQVATAIEQHYLPTGAGAALPDNAVARCVALADKLDTLVGIFGIGLAPTGDKDPFALRRQAAGVMRIVVEESLALDVRDLLERARTYFTGIHLAPTVVNDVQQFMRERLRSYLREQGFGADEIDAVLAVSGDRLDSVLPRLRALQGFRAMPEAAALAAANKRIHNILKQAGGDAGKRRLDGARLEADAEKALVMQLMNVGSRVTPLIGRGDYAAALRELATLRTGVDKFFDDVMVMVPDAELRDSRLALVGSVRELFMHIADISRLQAQ